MNIYEYDFQINNLYIYIMTYKIKMHETIYCYKHLLCIYYHYIYHYLADADIPVLVMCMWRQAMTAQRGTGSACTPPPTQAGYADSMLYCIHGIHCKCTLHTVSRL